MTTPVDGTGPPPAGPGNGAQVPRPRPPGEDARSEYAGYRVLLDEPAEHLAFGFGEDATALAEMITSSRAEFAIGIFGSWGSGKTTLMRAIERQLATRADVVTVWFTAWRYEREPHLIIPLLDVLREALRRKDEIRGRAPWARAAAVKVARAGRAFLAGLTLTAGVAGFSAAIEPGKIIDEISASDDDDQALSFYHAGFSALRDAISGLAASDAEAGSPARRVVIFVDDLDRCLPENALELLESIKLFFDVEGCVFVVGLDRDIAMRAVAGKFEQGRNKVVGEPVSAAAYVRKIFQVPFTLPPVTGRQLAEYLDAVERNSGFGPGQLEDFQTNVRAHFRFLRSQEPVNPREIKELINSYTLQLKMLSGRLAGAPDHNVILALLCMNYRDDWRYLYDQFIADPGLLPDVLRDALRDGGWPAEVWPESKPVALPADFVEYLKGPAQSMLRATNLDAYLSAAELGSGDRWAAEARVMISRLRRLMNGLAPADPDAGKRARAANEALTQLISMIGSRHEKYGRLHVLQERMGPLVRELAGLPRDWATGGHPELGAIVPSWIGDASPLLDSLDELLRQFHRYISLGPG